MLNPIIMIPGRVIDGGENEIEGKWIEGEWIESKWPRVYPGVPQKGQIIKREDDVEPRYVRVTQITYSTTKYYELRQSHVVPLMLITVEPI